MTSNWRDRATKPLLTDTDPCGEPHNTSLDRRWLWRLENNLAIHATTDTLRQLRADLAQYLNETCEHHWLNYEANEVWDAHKQCLWCCDVTVADEMEWRDCTPALLASGIHCPTTPRRPGHGPDDPGPLVVSHQHLVPKTTRPASVPDGQGREGHCG